MPHEDLPPVYQAELDEPSCLTLFQDVAALTDEVQINVKFGATAITEASSTWTLADARDALIGGAIRAVQLRYVHEEVVWLDTVMRTTAGYRVVRMRELAQ